MLCSAVGEMDRFDLKCLFRQRLRYSVGAVTNFTESMADSVADVADIVEVASLRRNGKKPSCEPCRKSKLSCDHIRPVCGRCSRRRAPERCVYHPAPMSNAQRPSPSSTRESQPVREDHDGNQRQPTKYFAGHDSNTSPPRLKDRITESSPPVSGFLGPTSYSAVFTEGQSHIRIENNKLSGEIDTRGWQPTKLPCWDSSKVTEGAEVLSLLANLSRYEPTLNRWFEVQCLAAITFYIRECIARIPPDLKDSQGRSESLTTWSHKIFLGTSTPYSSDANISLREYSSFLMGENLSWETVGLMLTTLGLSAISMDEVSVYDEFSSQTNWKDIAQQLLQAGDKCIAFCEQFGHLKDTGVTLIMMNFILHTQVYGDAGEHAKVQALFRDCSDVL